MSHFVSESAGQPCKCGTPSTHKVAEEIPHDDPSMTWQRLAFELEGAQYAVFQDRMRLNEYELPSQHLQARVDDIKSQMVALTPEQMPRHEFTAYICCTCFTALLGPATGCPL